MAENLNIFDLFSNGVQPRETKQTLTQKYLDGVLTVEEYFKKMKELLTDESIN